MATESNEFKSLRVTRAHLLQSIAAREAEPNPSPDFQISTQFEKNRVGKIEGRMEEINPEGFKALKAAEADAAKAAADAQAKADAAEAQ